MQERVRSESHAFTSRIVAAKLLALIRGVCHSNGEIDIGVVSGGEAPTHSAYGTIHCLKMRFIGAGWWATSQHCMEQCLKLILGSSQSCSSHLSAKYFERSGAPIIWDVCVCPPWPASKVNPAHSSDAKFSWYPSLSRPLGLSIGKSWERKWQHLFVAMWQRKSCEKAQGTTQVLERFQLASPISDLPCTYHLRMGNQQVFWQIKSQEASINISIQWMFRLQTRHFNKSQIGWKILTPRTKKFKCGLGRLNSDM